jgi:predicted ribosomally synthesized peptide with SipW-like signal peptide
MRKRLSKKFLLSVTAILTAIALVAGGTYAWFTASAPADLQTYGSGTLKIAYGSTQAIWGLDDQGLPVKRALPLDDQGNVITDPNTGLPAWDTQDWVPWSGFQPGFLYPDTEAYPPEPAPSMTYQNVGTIDAFVDLGAPVQVNVLKRDPVADTAKYGVKGTPISSKSTNVFWRNQPDDSTVKTVGFDADGNPIYIPDTSALDYGTHAWGDGSLVVAPDSFDPTSVISWAEADGTDMFADPDATAALSKAQLWMDTTGEYPDVYAFMPGDVTRVAGTDPVPIQREVSMDWKLHADYIDNWYNNTYAKDANGDDLAYPLAGTKISFGAGFDATQAVTDAITYVLGINKDDFQNNFQQAFIDDGSMMDSAHPTVEVSGSPFGPIGTPLKGDGQIRSFMYLVAKYGLYGIVPAGTDPGAFGVVNGGGVKVDGLTAVRNFAQARGVSLSLDSYIAKVDAIRASLGK